MCNVYFSLNTNSSSSSSSPLSLILASAYTPTFLPFTIYILSWLLNGKMWSDTSSSTLGGSGSWLNNNQLSISCFVLFMLWWKGICVFYGFLEVSCSDGVAYFLFSSSFLSVGCSSSSFHLPTIWNPYSLLSSSIATNYFVSCGLFSPYYLHLLSQVFNFMFFLFGNLILVFGSWRFSSVLILFLTFQLNSI